MATGKTIFSHIWNTYEADTTQKKSLFTRMAGLSTILFGKIKGKVR